MSEKVEIQRVDATDDDPVVINPINGEPMDKLQIGDVKIDRCPTTGAIWLDRGELAQLALLDAQHKGLLKKLDKPNTDAPARAARRGPLKSPRTGAVMMVVNDPEQRHVEFEVCPASGGCFFDAGELADLTEYTFRERLRVLLG
ncbi:MAG: zf-TFIIB domain-containing protein [Planctomycetota bacterium]